MYEIDFLPVESEGASGSKCGDAIALRLKPDGSSRDPFIVVVDGGYGVVGDRLRDHLRDYYSTSHVDLLISTHPDADHINGLVKLLGLVSVDEVWVHRPRLHNSRVSDYSNIEAIDNLLQAAEASGATVREPFTGLAAFDGRIQVLGPTIDYYEELLAQSLAQVRGGSKVASLAHNAFSKSTRKLASVLDNILTGLPTETLTDGGETDPRNNTSVITLVDIDSDRIILTGDAGIPALERAAARYEAVVGTFDARPLRFLQVPHHGSRRNVGPTILNRLLGTATRPHDTSTDAFVSSAQTCQDHPRASVINAFARRGCRVSATEGRQISTGKGAADRPGWVKLEPIPPLDETAENE